MEFDQIILEVGNAVTILREAGKFQLLKIKNSIKGIIEFEEKFSSPLKSELDEDIRLYINGLCFECQDYLMITEEQKLVVTVNRTLDSLLNNKQAV